MCISLKLIPKNREGRLCFEHECLTVGDNANVPQSHL